MALTFGWLPAVVNPPATGYCMTISDVKMHIAVLYFHAILPLNMDIDEAKSSIRNVEARHFEKGVSLWPLKVSELDLSLSP